VLERFDIAAREHAMVTNKNGLLDSVYSPSK
jgi:hypothetical protein